MGTLKLNLIVATNNDQRLRTPKKISRPPARWPCPAQRLPPDCLCTTQARLARRLGRISSLGTIHLCVSAIILGPAHGLGSHVVWAMAGRHLHHSPASGHLGWQLAGSRRQAWCCGILAIKKRIIERFARRDVTQDLSAKADYNSRRTDAKQINSGTNIHSHLTRLAG